MELTEFQELFDGISLTPEVSQRLKAKISTPEGEVECYIMHSLITNYNYSPKQIAMQVPAGAGINATRNIVTADIVVYRDKSKTEPFIVIEAKRKGTNLDKWIKQAESYARNIGADYHACSDGDILDVYRTAKYANLSTKIGSIFPTWGSDKPEDKYLAKTHILPPFKDEEQLRTIVKKCHDKIFFNLGHDPAKSFDELMKMLFVKMYDERVTEGEYRFAILKGQSKKDVADNIKEIFSKATKSARYSDVFTTRFSKPGYNIFLDLDDDTIYYVVKMFQHYSLVNTTSTLEGVDIKGTVFERMVGSTFRGELGAYFTPRELVEFCIKMLSPTVEDTILDPSCGSGGFLIMAIKYIKEKIVEANPNLTEVEVFSSLRDFCEKNVFGVDINERMVRVCKMNMTMHGDGHSGIFNSHGLNIGQSDRLPIRKGSVTKIFSNPPFAGRESDEQILARFETSKTDEGKIISLHKTIPFVEMIIDLLEDGGEAALVLPNGILNSPSRTFRKLRQIIYEKTTILGAVSLPHWVFFHTGCDVQGSLLFLKKQSPPADYDIFLDWADNVGYDAKGTKTSINDLGEIYKHYTARKKENLFKFSLIKKNDRFDPLFYRPGKFSDYFKKNPKTVLSDFVEPLCNLVKRNKKNETLCKYLEVSGVDPHTGKILELKEYKICDLPSRAKYIGRADMILLPNHRNSIAAKRAPVLLEDEHDGIIITSRFIPLKCKVPSIYVFHILNLDIIKEKLLQTVTGSSSTEIKWDVIKNIPIPQPENNDYDTFLSDIIEAESKIEQHRKLLVDLQKEQSERFENLFL